MSNNKKFAKLEYEFLLNAADDYVPLDSIVIDCTEDPRFRTKEKAFLRALAFIAYLSKKYGQYFSYSIGPGDPIDKTLEEFLSWMKQKFYEGKYEEIYYGIWFELHLAVIPPEFISPPTGRLMSKNFAIGALPKQHAKCYIDSLIVKGAKKVPKLSYTKGTWYQLPDGTSFGIRHTNSTKDAHYRTIGAIDIENLKVTNSKRFKVYITKKEKFAEGVYAFLSRVAIGPIALNAIVQDWIKDSFRSVPNEKEFLDALDFIAYLFKKYGKYLSYSIGSADPIDKTPEEFLSWMKQEFYEGKYEALGYGIWFDLDKAVIPPEFIPSPIENPMDKHPAISVLTKQQSQHYIDQLLAKGAKKVPKRSYTKGTWYQLPDGTGFGVRHTHSEKAAHYGIIGSIDIENLKLANPKKIKFYISKKEKFAEQGHAFLSRAAIDYVAPKAIVQDWIKDSFRSVPNEKEFLDALAFIEHLFKKYGTHLAYFRYPVDPIEKTPEELLNWMKNKFYEGKYEALGHGVWFELDKAVIPPEFLPTPL